MAVHQPRPWVVSWESKRKPASSWENCCISARWIVICECCGIVLQIKDAITAAQDVEVVAWWSMFSQYFAQCSGNTTMLAQEAALGQDRGTYREDV